jgi:hypothetical protein
MRVRICYFPEDSPDPKKRTEENNDIKELKSYLRVYWAKFIIALGYSLEINDGILYLGTGYPGTQHKYLLGMTCGMISLDGNYIVETSLGGGNIKIDRKSELVFFSSSFGLGDYNLPLLRKAEEEILKKIKVKKVEYSRKSVL